jgi:hypothetical protein
MGVREKRSGVVLVLKDDDAYWLPVVLMRAVNAMREFPQRDPGMLETQKHLISIGERLAARVKRLKERR